MSEIYEHQYLVFSVEDGPRVINEALNASGREGWFYNNYLKESLKKSFTQSRD